MKKIQELIIPMVIFAGDIITSLAIFILRLPEGGP